jgi:DNA-binding response OmpR family regulator
VPVIAISGFLFRHSAQPAPDFLTMATKLGAAYSLPKPFRPKDLLQVVEACLSDQGEPIRIALAPPRSAPKPPVPEQQHRPDQPTTAPMRRRAL